MKLPTWYMQSKKITSQLFFFPLYLYKVSGNSMEPAIHEKDIIFVVHKSLAHFNIGNVVLFKKNSMLMVKRIKKVKMNEFEVEGDNISQSTDSRNFGPIRENEIIGRVVKIFHVSR